MSIESVVEISLNKKKLILFLTSALLFVVIGLFLIVGGSGNKNAMLLLIAGIISALFFGLIAVIVTVKLFDNKAGLIIDDEGIKDNSSGLSAGLIPWREIIDIRMIQVGTQRFIMVDIADPEGFLKSIPGVIKRKAMDWNFKNYGSPIAITANTLSIQLNTLYEMLRRKLRSYQMRT